MHSDPIADFLIRIKNGYMAKKPEVKSPTSKIKRHIAEILKHEQFIEDMSEDGKVMVVTLKYVNGRPAMTDIKRISKPGLRVYVSKKHVPSVLKGRGVAIISTSQGLTTDKDARAKSIGGEIIAKVW